MIVVSVVLILIYIFKSIKNKGKAEVKKEFPPRYYYVERTVFWLLILVATSFVYFALFFFMVFNSSSSLVVFYENKEIRLEYEGMYYPQEIKCTIENEKGRVEVICPFDIYGEGAGVESVSIDEYGETTDFNKNYYCYTYNIDISRWREKGFNKISLEFSIDNVNYRIFNTLHYNKEYDYTRSEIVVDL
ncbi:MAG: hypothetical protein IJ327_00835 [Lachnospiraceae bacterium]|nr:hypothetical protein [Lachnospiraceae bacterium]